MSLGFQIYPDRQLLFIRGEGVITQTERIRTMLAWLRDPEYEQCTDALFDITSADSTPKPEEMRELITILQRHLPVQGPRKLAIITSKPITYVVARLFENLIRVRALPIQVKVFLDRERAWAWLRPEEPFPRRDGGGTSVSASQNPSMHS